MHGGGSGVPRIVHFHFCAHSSAVADEARQSAREWEGCPLFLMGPTGVISWEQGFRMLGLVVDGTKGSWWGLNRQNSSPSGLKIGKRGG